MLDKIIKNTTNFFILKILKLDPAKEKYTKPDERKKIAYLESWVSIVGNFFLSIIKILLGMILNSISLIADGIHTASDVLTSVAVLLGFKFSAVPPDEKHPYGHGRIEFLASLLIALLLTVVGFEFGKSSYERFIANEKVAGSYLVAFFMLVSAIFKEWMSRFSIELGNRISAQALIADAWHHRTDAIASVLVAVAIISSKYGYYKVDAVFGFLVSALIIYTGATMAYESCSKLIGEIAQEEMIKEIQETAYLFPHVVDVHKVFIHDYGAYKEISMHVVLNHELTFFEAHELSEKIERQIEEKIHCNVTVNVEPSYVKNDTNRENLD